MTNETDQLYIDKVLKGDTNAFAFLVEKYKVMVFSMSVKLLKNKEEAEEVSQDTFIKAYKNLANFERKSKFSTWLYRIAYRNCLDVLKKNSIRYNFTDINEITINQIEATETVLDGIEKAERSQLINECLQKLPEEERTILWLFYFKELSLNEIVDITSLSKSNVKVKLHRARKLLLTIVKRDVEPEIINHYGRK